MFYLSWFASEISNLLINASWSSYGRFVDCLVVDILVDLIVKMDSRERLGTLVRSYMF